MASEKSNKCNRQIIFKHEVHSSFIYISNDKNDATPQQQYRFEKKCKCIERGSLCHVKIILNTQHAMFQASSLYLTGLLSFLAFFFTLLQLIVFLHRLHYFFFLWRPHCVELVINDRWAVLCAVFAMHLCDSFESLLFLPFFKMSKTRDKGWERGRETERRGQTTKERRDTHLMGHCDIYLCKTLDAHTQSSSLNVSFHSFVLIVVVV